jgi:L-ascorbate metabolism protein UlaG (beta-lactamase superfamily)
MRVGEIDIYWLGHAGFLIRNSRVIYIDPYKIKEGLPKADMIFITHSHYDHCSVEDLQKIVKEGTRIICPPDSQSKIARFEVPIRMEIVEVGQDLEFNGVKVSVFPAYNIDKSFHSKDEGLVGYVIKVDDCVVYHAGDTDFIPEMEKLTGFNGEKFVCLLPVGGRFTMDAHEAYEAVKLIKPGIAIPMHWGTIVGTKEDAEEFKEICEKDGFRVEILDKF